MRPTVFGMRWLLLSLIVGGVAVALLLARWRSTPVRPDLGAVSGQWIAAHRSDQPDQ
jgi:hypothetical protein